MSESVITILPLLALIALLLAGVPVAFALGVSGFVGVTMISGLAGGLNYLATVPYREAAHYTLLTLPLFLLMGHVASRAGITETLFDAAYKWLGRLRAGVAHASILAAAGFAALSGSSLASAAAFSPIVVREMKRLDYDEKLGMGIVAAAGTFACMIPPSIAFIVYGTLTHTSISELFMAGIIPGIMSALLYMISIAIRAKTNPALTPKVPAPFTVQEKLIVLGRAWPALVIIFVVLGGIYLGIMTPTEAGAVGAVGVVTIGLAKRYLSATSFKDSILDSAKTTATIFMIIIGAFIFGYFLSLAEIPQASLAFFAGLELPSWAILLLILAVYVLLGTFTDQIAILCLTLPITFPLAVGLGFEPVWFGVLVTKTVEIGLITPPLGLNVYIVQQATKEPLGKVFSAIFPFLAVDVITLALLIAFPQITLFLPGLMK